MMRIGDAWIWGSTIGLDLGARLVKACQRDGDGWRSLVMVREREGSFTDQEVGVIVRALARRGMVGTRVAVSVPSESVMSVRASTPRENSGAPIEDIARQELARSNDCEAGLLLSASWSAKSNRARGDLDERQVFGCSSAVAFSLQRSLALHGMDMIALEPSAVSSMRGGADAAEWSDSGGLAVDLGWSGARLIAARAGRLAYERGVSELGQLALCREIARCCSWPEGDAWLIGGLMSRRGGMEALVDAERSVAGVVERFAEALMVEIERGVAFAGERYGIASDDGVLLTGGGAMGSLGAALQSMSGGQLVQAGDEALSPIHATARGLSLITEEIHAVR